MEFQEPYLLAMREQVPKMFMELRRSGRLPLHLAEKTKAAYALLRQILADHPNPGPAERQRAEEMVRAQLIEFPSETSEESLREPPEDLGENGSGRKPGEYQTLMSKVKTTP